MWKFLNVVTVIIENHTILSYLQTTDLIETAKKQVFLLTFMVPKNKIRIRSHKVVCRVEC